ncbi:hypothetical protein HW532_12815 [Kaustia mangrovi]|uniref:Uncharacterized protein n=1 Tax=Kaustia mangrovi TaxID=2593653 RepID=A0A7S8HCJ0_9HYPH|nr:hypothetical protein [Kaustia mangrovi]QPC43499.1 hypothetical protein HW532_12815 [Kaustia mangrovi]
MAKPRTPRAKAETEGRDKINPGRYHNRVEPKVADALGDPPEWIADTEKNKAWTAWKTIATEVPWLNASHRTLVATASNIYGRMIAGQDVGVQAMNLLRQCLGQMGATPADASKVAMPDGDEKDPDDELFE